MWRISGTNNTTILSFIRLFDSTFNNYRFNVQRVNLIIVMRIINEKTHHNVLIKVCLHISLDKEIELCVITVREDGLLKAYRYEILIVTVNKDSMAQMSNESFCKLAGYCSSQSAVFCLNIPHGDSDFSEDKYCILFDCRGST